VVVAVGLTLVEPLAEVDVNVPGEIEILDAPVVDQLSVLLLPDFMLAGLAVKEVIVGAEPVPEGELELLQLPRMMQEDEIKASTQRRTTGGLVRYEANTVLQCALTA
jgi:hypothetical protein